MAHGMRPVHEPLSQVDSNTQYFNESLKQDNVKVIIESHETVRSLSAPPAVWWKGPSRISLTWELLGIFLSLCFLVLGICVTTLGGRSESSWSNRVVQATKIAPSIWPIIFSGIIGNALKALADWKAESGVELLTLEQLLGSLTMASSVITIFRWNLFKLSSVVLIVLWAFNPLGSQASFRGIYLKPTIGQSSGIVRYYNSSIYTQFGLSDFESGSGKSKTTMRGLYSSTLYDYISSTQYVNLENNTAKDIIAMLGGEKSAATQAATDNWGNVRIPTLEHLPGYNEKTPHSWVETAWDKKILNYSSLLGDRVEGIDRSIVGNTTYMVQSSYQSFSCKPWFFVNYTNSQSVGGNASKLSELDEWLLQRTGMNYTMQFSESAWRMGRTFFTSPFRRNMTTKIGVPEFIFGSRGDDITNYQLTTCTARTVYVDANVTCISRGSLGKANCGVTALRQTAEPPSDPIISTMHIQNIATNSLAYFMDVLEHSAGDSGLGGSGTSSPTVQYLNDPLTALATRELSRGYTELSNLDITTFERRFAMMYNTLWKISWAGRSAMGEKLQDPKETGTSARVANNIVLNATSSTSFPLPPVYAIDKAWLAVYFVSVVTMLAASFFALWFRARCRAPVLLGYVSSLLRDCTYFQAHNIQGNSTENGSAKARRLGAMKVMIGDHSNEHDAAGKMALLPAQMGRRIEKEKWYD